MAAGKHSMPSGKRKLQDMSVDEFFGADFDSESESSSTKSAEADPRRGKQMQSVSKKAKFTPAGVSREKNRKSVKGNKTVQKGERPASNASVKRMEIVNGGKVKKRAKEIISHAGEPDNKQSMASTLKDNDPEFYDFLKGQDKQLLLNLEDLSDSEDDSSDSENETIEQGKDKISRRDDRTFEKELFNMSSGDESDEEASDSRVHQLPAELEEASDDSADEEDESPVTGRPKKSKGGILLKHKMIETWTDEVKSKPSLPLLKEIISAFHAAVQEASGVDDLPVSKYRVEDGGVFNSIVRLCLTQLVPAFQTLLDLPALSEVRQVMSAKSARWKKCKVLVKSYITDLMELLKQLSEEAMINAILKHVHKLVIFYATFLKLTKSFLKRMINLWATGEETTRVLAFLCINKVVRLKQEALLESCLKQMYSAYVSNCKFTSPTTLPVISFMKKALVEIFTIDQTVAYQYAFVYIRQLAIHLRNALSVKKKNTRQAVYNWQFIHCLSLWVQLLSTSYPSDILQPLIYPVTQTIIGTIRLLPTAKYYPLRFHCVRLLNQLSSKTNTFIPTVPFLLEVFEQTDFNKRHKTVSLKPFNFAVILKFSKSQLHEKAFKDGLIEQLYEHLLESFNVQAHSIGFPELIIPSLLLLKDFLKKCKIANYCKQIKQIVDKIQEQSKFITDQRKQSNINLDDFQGVNMWESQLSDKGTPLRKYYTSWRKLRDRELQHEIANKEAISGAAFDIPIIERKKLSKATPEEREDFSKLFENDSDSDDETRFLLKEERPEKETKKQKHADVEFDSDDYSDFDDDELEQLAQSASSGDESEDIADSNDDMNSSEEDDDQDSDNHFSQNQNKLMQLQGNNAMKSFSQTSTQEDEDDVVEDFVLSDYD